MSRLVDQVEGQVASFSENTQNTHGLYVSTAIAKLIYDLSPTYLNGRNEVDVIADLKFEIQQYALNPSGYDYSKVVDVLTYIDRKILSDSGNSNGFDNVIIYIPTENAVEEKLTTVTPRQTLAIVYLALCDSDKIDHGKTIDEKLSNLRNRLFTLYKCLEFLAENYDGMICHSGQRNMIALCLNHVYPNVEIIEEPNAYVLNYAKTFLEEQIRKLSAKEQFSLLKAQLDLKSTSAEFAEFAELTKTTFIRKVMAACIAQGLPLNFSRNNNKTLGTIIGETAEALSALELVDVHPNALVMKQIFEIVYQEREPNDLRGAFQLVKERLDQCRTFDDMAMYLKEWPRCYRLYLEVVADRFIGNGPPELLTGLLGFLSRGELREPIELTVQGYFDTWRPVKASGPDRDFVANYFCVLSAFGKNDGPARTEYHAQLMHEAEKIKLSDIALRSFLASHVNAVLDVSPYEINRVLLHAMLVSPQNWSPNFCVLFGMIVDFIKAGLRTSVDTSVQEGVRNTLMKDSYPPHLVLLLDIFVFLKSQEGVVDAQWEACVEASNDYLKVDVWALTPTCYVDILDGKFSEYLKTKDQRLTQVILTADELLEYLNCLNPEECTTIFDAVKNQLGDLITDARQLRRLLDCKELDDAQRSIIWRAVNNGIGDLIHNGDELLELFNCNRLVSQQHAVIWKAVKGSLGQLIKKGYQLCGLLNCGAFSEAHYTAILEATQNQLGELIGQDTLPKILECKNLTNSQRTFILDQLIGQYTLPMVLKCKNLTDSQRTLILKASEVLIKKLGDHGGGLDLLLSCEVLTEDHRTFILETAMPELLSSIDCQSDFLNLLGHKKLTDVHLTLILERFKDRLLDMASVYDGASRLMNFWGFKKSHREQIWGVFKDNLISLGGSVYGLCPLLDGPQLTVDQRTELWLAVEPHLYVSDDNNRLIYNVSTLLEVLNCAWFTDVQRTTILKAHQDLIKESAEVEPPDFDEFFHEPDFDEFFHEPGFVELFYCDKLTKSQRELILETVKDRPPTLIRDEMGLRRLLECKALTAGQRGFILETHKNKLQNYIRNFNTLIEYLNFDNINDADRALILGVLKRTLCPLLPNTAAPTSDNVLRAKQLEEALENVSRLCWPARRAMLSVDRLEQCLKDDSKSREEKLEAIATFHHEVGRTVTGNLLRVVAVVTFTALGLVIGAGIGFVIGYILGAWTGPGAALTALFGLTKGSMMGAALGLKLAAAATGTPFLVGSGCGLFILNKREKAIRDTAQMAENILSSAVA